MWPENGGQGWGWGAHYISLVSPSQLHNPFDAGRPGLKTQGDSRRTSQEDPWLHTGWKSSAGQPEVRSEFTEDIERPNRDGMSGRLIKGKDNKSDLCLKAWSFY